MITVRFINRSEAERWLARFPETPLPGDIVRHEANSYLVLGRIWEEGTEPSTLAPDLVTVVVRKTLNGENLLFDHADPARRKKGRSEWAGS